MTDLSNTSIRFSGDITAAQMLARQHIMREIEIFRNLTELGRLDQNKRTIIFDDGSIIEMKVDFETEVVNVYVPPPQVGVLKKKLKLTEEELRFLLPQIVLQDITEPVGGDKRYVNAVSTLGWGLAAVQIKENDEVNIHRFESELIPDIPSIGKYAEITTLEQLHHDKGFGEDLVEDTNDSDLTVDKDDTFLPYVTFSEEHGMIEAFTGVPTADLYGPNLAGTYKVGPWTDPHPWQLYAFADYSWYQKSTEFYGAIPFGIWSKYGIDPGTVGPYRIIGWESDGYTDTMNFQEERIYPTDAMVQTAQWTRTTDFTSSISMLGVEIASATAELVQRKDITMDWGIAYGGASGDNILKDYTDTEVDTQTYNGTDVYSLDDCYSEDHTYWSVIWENVSIDSEYVSTTINDVLQSGGYSSYNGVIKTYITTSERKVFQIHEYDPQESTPDSPSITCMGIYDYFGAPVYVYSFYAQVTDAYRYGIIYGGNHYQSPWYAADEAYFHEFFADRTKRAVGDGTIRACKRIRTIKTLEE